MNNQDRIIAGIKAFARPYKLEKCVDSLINAGIKNIRIGYDGPRSLKHIHKKILKNKDANIDIVEFPFNAGIGRMRNALVGNLNTDYFLLLDDDQYVPKNISDSIYLLDTMNSIEGIGFPWRLAGEIEGLYEKVTELLGKKYALETGNFYNFPKTRIINFEDYNIPTTKDEVFILNRREDIKIVVIDKHEYAIPFEYIPNSAIFRSSLFNKIRWDDNFVIGGEHQDFFYRASKLGLKFGVSLDIFVTHDLGRDKKIDFKYDEYRHGVYEEESNKYLKAKHKVWSFNSGLLETQLFRFDSFKKYIE